MSFKQSIISVTAFTVGLVCSVRGDRDFVRAETVNVGYELRIGAHAGLLAEPDNPATAMLAAWQTQHDLQLARNMPALMLFNRSDSPTTEITRFSMTIGDASHNFDWAKVIDTSPGVEVMINQIDSEEDGLRGDLLEFEFSNFVKDAFVSFRIDIDPDSDSVFPFCDFRQVLFDGNGADSVDNSMVAVSFEDPEGMDSLNITNRLEDFAVDGPFIVGPNFHSYNVMDHVGVFASASAGTLKLAGFVPEPQAVQLLVLGFGCLLGLTPRGRRGLGQRINKSRALY